MACGLVVLVLAIVGACVYFLPEILLRRELTAAGFRGLQAADRAKAENDIRTSLIQAVGGVLVLVGAFAAWRQLRLSQQQLLLSRDELIHRL
jgi:hypothetical protein